MPQIKNKVHVKKVDYNQVVHTKQWFIDRVGKSIFYRITNGLQITRSYCKIETVSQAEALYVHQNISGKRYFS